MQDDSELHNALQILPSVPQNIPHSSENSGIDGTNAEDLSILLPSSLGWEWCVQHGAQNLVEKEAKLCVAQDNDAIHSMHLVLGFKSALFRGQVQQANTQQMKTWAWDAVHSVDTTAHQHT
jgi:hypothetical protein